MTEENELYDTKVENFVSCEGFVVYNEATGGFLENVQELYWGNESQAYIFLLVEDAKKTCDFLNLQLSLINEDLAIEVYPIKVHKKTIVQTMFEIDWEAVI